LSEVRYGRREKRPGKKNSCRNLTRKREEKRFEKRRSTGDNGKNENKRQIERLRGEKGPGEQREEGPQKNPRSKE